MRSAREQKPLVGDPQHLSRCAVRELLCSGELMSKGMHSCCQRPADAEVQHLWAAK